MKEWYRVASEDDLDIDQVTIVTAGVRDVALIQAVSQPGVTVPHRNF